MPDTNRDRVRDLRKFERLVQQVLSHTRDEISGLEAQLELALPAAAAAAPSQPAAAHSRSIDRFSDRLVEEDLEQKQEEGAIDDREESSTATTNNTENKTTKSATTDASESTIRPGKRKSYELNVLVTAHDALLPQDGQKHPKPANQEQGKGDEDSEGD